MNLNKLTEKAQEAIVAAQAAAENHRNTQVEPEHLLQALLTQQEGAVPAVLERMGLDPRRLTQQVETLIDQLPKLAGAGQQVYASPKFRQVFDAAQQEAARLKDDFLSTEHFLLAMVDHAGRAAQALRQAGANRERLYRALQEVRGGQRVTSQNRETTYQSLEKYGRDLTKAARLGRALMPLSGAFFAATRALA